MRTMALYVYFQPAAKRVQKIYIIVNCLSFVWLKRVGTDVKLQADQIDLSWKLLVRNSSTYSYVDG